MAFDTLARVGGSRLAPGVRGDPGFFSTLGKIVGTVGRVLPGPIGGIATAVGGLLGGAGPSRPTARPTGLVPFRNGVGAVVRPGPVMAPPAVVFGGAGAFGGGGVGRALVPAMNGACPSGFHPAKDGSGRCVRNRRTNFANSRALNRSIRRVEGFGRLVQRSKSSIRKAANLVAPQPRRGAGRISIRESGPGSVRVR